MNVLMVKTSHGSHTLTCSTAALALLKIPERRRLEGKWNILLGGDYKKELMRLEYH